jgi:hypothetical protein
MNLNEFAMRTQHSPGPWHVTHGPRGLVHIRTEPCAPSWPDGKAIAQVVAGAVGEAEAAANARLFVAAPDLLAAARAALVEFQVLDAEHVDVADEPWRALRAAIARAEGRV